MASNTAEIALFLKQCHSTATVNTITTVKNINLINDTERMLVYPPELISVDFNHYTERYLIKLSETTEATLTAMMSDIINNIDNLNKRIAVGTFTRPSTMLNAELKNSNKAFENGITKRWDRDIYIDVEWSTA